MPRIFIVILVILKETTICRQIESVSDARINNIIKINPFFFSGSTDFLNATWPGGVDPSTYHTYTFSITGSGTSTVTFTGFINGTQYITATDDGSVNPILTTGKTGFDFNTVSKGFITNFQVKEP